MNNELIDEKLITEDPQISQLLNKIKTMSEKELITDILRHEKEVKGIDWAQLGVDQSLSSIQIKEKANNMAKTYLRKLQAELELKDEDLPDFTRDFLNRSYSASDVQVMPAWGIDEEEAAKWKNASGDKLKDMITYRLKIMQSLELSSSPTAYSQIMLSIGVIAWMKKGYDIYQAARVAGLLRMAAVVRAIKGITIQVTKMFVATVIVGVIAEIILYLMEKEAVVYMVLLNMTDDDLKMDNLHLSHGKQMVQFVNPKDETQQENILIKRTITDLGGGEVDICYWMGLFVAQKKDMALYGSQGAFRFAKCNTYPQGAYVGWEITLSGFFAGPNRCLVSANDEGDTERFSIKTDRQGTLNSESRNSRAKVTGRMHSGSGSKGYMSAIFEPLT